MGTSKHLVVCFLFVSTVLLLFTACASQTTLRERELMRLDPVLRSVVVDGKHPGPLYEIRTLPDGTVLYGVVIRTNDLDRLRNSGIPLLSTGGGTATALLTLDEVKQAVRIRGVQSIHLATSEQLR